MSRQEIKQPCKMLLVETGHTGTQVFQFCRMSEKCHKKVEEGQYKDGGEQYDNGNKAA